MLLEIIVIALFISIIFNIILNKFRMPTIIGYIITGTFISYIFGLHELAGNHDLQIVSELGIAFLMFTIGLEFSLKQLVKMKKSVFLYGGLQFFITSIIFFLIGTIFLNLDSKQSLIIAVGLSLSSTAIVLKVLKESGEINKKYGNRSLGILLFQDLMVVPILLLITVFSESDTNLGILITKTLIGGFLLLIILWFIGKYLLDYFFYKVAKTKSNEIFIASVLFTVVGASILAHNFGFSYTLGAFIAGMLIAETHYKHQVEADLIPFRDLLLGFFFVTVGMQLKLSIIYENLSIIVILLISLILFKIITLYLILINFNKKKAALKTALTLFQFGEFGIVVFEIAVLKGQLATEIGQAFVVIIIISMISTPFILKNINKISDYIFGEKCSDKEGSIINKNLNKHVILIGYGRLGKIISRFLDKSKVEYIIIENDIKTYKEAKKVEKPVIFGNAFQESTLKSANIQKAGTVVISIGNSDEISLIASLVRKMNTKVNTVVKANNFKDEEKLKELNIKNIIVESEKTAFAMFEKIKAKGLNRVKGC